MNAVYIDDTISVGGKEGRYMGTAVPDLRFYRNPPLYIPHGKGIMRYKDGSMYAGQWNNGLYSGHGKYTEEKTGCMRVGMWSKGLQTGRGKHITHDGWKYEGTYVNGRLEGVGSQTNGKGHSYSGRYRDNFPHGKGIWRYPNGNWTKKDGKGNESWRRHEFDGSIYEGVIPLCYDNPYKGKKTYMDGSVYEGWFVARMRNGYGSYKTSCGMLYEGNWCDDVKEGYFTVTHLASGTKKRCKY